MGTTLNYLFHTVPGQRSLSHQKIRSKAPPPPTTKLHSYKAALQITPSEVSLPVNPVKPPNLVDAPTP
ncbi:hypothetical protein Csa_001469 [Cucumis sativus]|uniref:Uncharacterized protein n=1 Tax=Cucumis sativus TaxID=3659 RepID=A0A0A0LCS2_CUCSA|nr:hypothetical protein Csa_001469 [Cucumis sativus]